MPIDPKELKAGDRVVVLAKSGDLTHERLATALGTTYCHSASGHNVPLVYLDAKLTANGSSFHFTDMSSIADRKSAQQAMKALGLDEAKHHLWYDDDGSTSFELHEKDPKQKAKLDPKTLKVGDRVRLSIQQGSAWVSRTAVVIDPTHYLGKPIVHLDQPYSHLGTVSYRAHTQSMRDAMTKLGLDVNTANLWHESGNDTIFEELLSADPATKLPIDPKVLKAGDRVKLTIKVPGGTPRQMNATILTGNDPAEHRAVYLDELFVDQGWASFPSGWIGASESVVALGLDPKDKRTWRIHPVDTTIDEVLPPRVIDPQSLKPGQRIKFERDGKPCDGVVLKTNYFGEFWLAEDKATAKWYGGVHSKLPRPGVWRDLSFGGFATAAGISEADYGLTGIYLDKIKVLSVEPKSESIDQLDQAALAVGDEIEIEINRNGTLVKRKAVVVATAKDEQAWFKNDSEAGVFLYDESKDAESASFNPLEHWKASMGSLALPMVSGMGWRLYKDGRNQTKVIRKLGKRNPDKAADSTASVSDHGRKIEAIAYDTNSNRVLCRGTALELPSGSFVLLDSQEVAAHASAEDVALAGPLAEALGLPKVDMKRLVYAGYLSARTALQERLIPKPRPPPDLKTSIDTITTLIDAGLASPQVMLDTVLVKQVVEYAKLHHDKQLAIEAKVEELTALNVDANKRWAALNDKHIASLPAELCDAVDPAADSIEPESQAGTKAIMVIGTALGALLSAICSNTGSTPTVRVNDPASVLEATELTETVATAATAT